MLTAQKRIVSIRGKQEGESCLDLAIVQALVSHVIENNDSYDPSAPGLARFIVRFIDEEVVPLITASAPLWQLVSKLALWRRKPSSRLRLPERMATQRGWKRSLKPWASGRESRALLGKRPRMMLHVIR